jgi:hypothetical protein
MRFPPDINHHLLEVIDGNNGRFLMLSKSVGGLEVAIAAQVFYPEQDRSR